MKTPMKTFLALAGLVIVSGTGAMTRVMIEFCVPDGTVWRTVGLSTNIIDASVAALGDGMIWKLQHDKVAGPKPNDD